MRHGPDARATAAYTLIEQIMVMLIIGIVLAMIIGLARYVNQRSNRALAGSELELWKHAIAAYVNHYGQVPNGETNCPLFVRFLPPGFEFTDPWGNLYQYEVLSEQAYRIFSAGPDGQPGTADDVYAD